MRKDIFIIGSIIVLVVFAIVIFTNNSKKFSEKEQVSPNIQNSGKNLEEQQEISPATQQKIIYKDCGTSDVCFSTYVKTCTPAKATISDQELTYVETIKGYKDNNCILNLVYTDSPLSEIIGKEMDCGVPKTNLDNFKNYLQGEMMKKSCSGSLIDYMVQLEQ
ncbi:MAG: hypothetical protein Q8N99_07780 [Nanoarchaeota archaeon]|nr:hypothetical protein [Nanoarchaeota archaeon]